MSKKPNYPPRLARWILYRLDHYEKEFSIIGDCSEEFRVIASQKGRMRAVLWIWWQVLCAVPSHFKLNLTFGVAMLKNYLKIAYRNFKRAKMYSFIIGIVKDFHFSSLHNKILPLILRIEPENSSYYTYLYDVVMIRLNPDDISQTISTIEKTYKRFDSQFPFVYFFLDEQIDRFYRTEHKLFQIFNYFSFLAVFIACLGIFGMLSCSIENRTKEIGIRKVLGANVAGIVKLISKDFIKCVLLANIIAWPIAYWALNRWLQSFAYRVNLDIKLFILSAMITMGIAWMTVGYQALKAATANPVD